jgi:hypothetical protein
MPGLRGYKLWNSNYGNTTQIDDGQLLSRCCFALKEGICLLSQFPVQQSDTRRLAQ